METLFSCPPFLLFVLCFFFFIHVLRGITYSSHRSWSNYYHYDYKNLLTYTSDHDHHHVACAPMQTCQAYVPIYMYLLSSNTTEYVVTSSSHALMQTRRCPRCASARRSTPWPMTERVQLPRRENDWRRNQVAQCSLAFWDGMHHVCFFGCLIHMFRWNAPACVVRLRWLFPQRHTRAFSSQTEAGARAPAA